MKEPILLNLTGFSISPIISHTKSIISTQGGGRTIHSPATVTTQAKMNIMAPSSALRAPPTIGL